MEFKYLDADSNKAANKRIQAEWKGRGLVFVQPKVSEGQGQYAQDDGIVPLTKSFEKKTDVIQMRMLRWRPGETIGMR